jgi:hypothetical protein
MIEHSNGGNQQAGKRDAEHPKTQVPKTGTWGTWLEELPFVP